MNTDIVRVLEKDENMAERIGRKLVQRLRVKPAHNQDNENSRPGVMIFLTDHGPKNYKGVARLIAEIYQDEISEAEEA